MNNIRVLTVFNNDKSYFGVFSSLEKIIEYLTDNSLDHGNVNNVVLL